MTSGTTGAPNRASRIIIAGEAGQGVRLAGVLLAEAAARIHRYVSEASVFGAAVRQGQVTSHVQMSETPISYPLVETPDCLLVSSKRGYERHAVLRPRPSLVIYDSTRVSPVRTEAGTIGVPAAGWLIDEFHNDRGAVLMLLGALAATTGIVSLDSLKETAAGVGSPRQREINIIALEQGGVLRRSSSGDVGSRGFKTVTVDLERCERSSPRDASPPVKDTDRICRICELTCPDLAISTCVRTGAVQIDIGRCKACGLCAHFCPREAISLG